MKNGPLSEELAALFNKLSSTAKSEQQKIWEALEKHLDGAEKKHISPGSFKDAVLVLNVSSPCWMYTINFKKDMLLREAQKEIGESKIKSIRLKIGRVK